MRFRYFIIAIILTVIIAVIIGTVIYELTNDTLVKSINRIQEHNHRLEEMNNLLSR